MNVFDATIDHATRGTWVPRTAAAERERDVEFCLIEIQLAVETLQRVNPNNGALNVLKKFIDSEVQKLDGETA